MSKEINGIIFEKMMRNALNNIYVHEQEINDMNVFPVADGDTGTNMRLTLENGLNVAPREKHFGKYLKSLATGMLLGARGNSGVILSQLFKGMSIKLINDSIVNPGELRDALINGYKTAYQAVLNPIEGTILTVCRLGIDNIKHLIKGSITQEETFKLYLEELNKQLELTPTLLSVLKDANVLDSGAKGYIVIVEGMYKYLIGQIIDRDLASDTYQANEKEKKLEKLAEGFYMEFQIKLKNDNNNFDNLEEKLLKLSSSFKYHINQGVLYIYAQANNPTPIISEAKKYGNVISFNLENKKLVEDKKEEDVIPFKAIVYIACVSGSGMKNLYKDMGVDIILNMNPSTQDFLSAFNRANAERIVVITNDKNIIETANQAVNLSSLNNITILPTKNMIEGYYALAMDVPDSSIENRLNEIQTNVGVECVSIAKAVKNYSKEDVIINVDDYVSYIGDQILASNKEIIPCLLAGLKEVKNIDSKSSAFVLIGKDAKNINEDILLDLFNHNYPSIDVTILDGGQDKEVLLIGLL